MEQLSGMWISAVSAVVWTLLQLYLENCVLIPSGSFLVNVLAPLLPSVEFSQEPMDGTWLFCLTHLLASMEFPQDPIYGWSCSADKAILITCADILAMSSWPDVSTLT